MSALTQEFVLRELRVVVGEANAPARYLKHGVLHLRDAAGAEVGTPQLVTLDASEEEVSAVLKAGDATLQREIARLNALVETQRADIATLVSERDAARLEASEARQIAARLQDKAADAPA